MEINGVPISWIDAKSFYGTASSSLQKKKTQKQIDRYTKEWGHGAIVFKHGFCDGLKLKGAILLDASSLVPNKKIHEGVKEEKELREISFAMTPKKPGENDAYGGIDEEIDGEEIVYKGIEVPPAG